MRVEIFGYHPAKENQVLENIEALYGELGRHPMNIERKIRMIKYWIKLLRSSDNSLLKLIF